MSNSASEYILTQTIDTLTGPSSLEGECCVCSLGSVEYFGKIIHLARAIAFPDYYRKLSVSNNTLLIHISVQAKRLGNSLNRKINKAHSVARQKGLLSALRGVFIQTSRNIKIKTINNNGI